MKKILLTLFLALALVGCDTATTQPENTYPEMDYNSFYNDRITDVNQQLTQSESTYYIYIYGDNCSACKAIKNEALYTIEFLQNDQVYFVEAESTSQIAADIVTIGQATNPNFGTPSIVKIENGLVVEVISGGSSVLNVLHSLS